MSQNQNSAAAEWDSLHGAIVESERRIEQTKDRIRSRALELLAEHGFAALGSSDTARFIYYAMHTEGDLYSPVMDDLHAKGEELGLFDEMYLAIRMAKDAPYELRRLELFIPRVLEEVHLAEAEECLHPVIRTQFELTDELDGFTPVIVTVKRKSLTSWHSDEFDIAFNGTDYALFYAPRMSDSKPVARSTSLRDILEVAYVDGRERDLPVS